MTKHLADHRSPSDTPSPALGRRTHFWALEKQATEDRPHAAIRTLLQRPQDRSDAGRLAQYLRIARGRTA